MKEKHRNYLLPIMVYLVRVFGQESVFGASFSHTKQNNTPSNGKIAQKGIIITW